MTKIIAPDAIVVEYTGEDGHRYREHVFTSSGSFVVKEAGEVCVAAYAPPGYRPRRRKQPHDDLAAYRPARKGGAA